MKKDKFNRDIININEDNGVAADGPVPDAPPGDLREVGEFCQKWREETIRSGAVTVEESPLPAAEADALVQASRAQRPAYDPERRPDDAAREEQCAQAARTTKMESRALLNDHSRARQAQAKAAAEGCSGPPPTLPWWLTPSAAGSLSSIFAISLHDLAAGLGVSDGASWLLGAVLGLLLGSFLVLVQLHLVGLPGLRRGAFWGGVGVAVGIGLMRGVAATDLIEVVTGLALAAVETGILVVVDRVGHAHGARYATWAEHDARIKDAANACAVREERIRKAEAIIAERNAEVADRARRSNPAALESLFLRAAHAVVAEGLHVNRGRLLGGGQ